MKLLKGKYKIRNRIMVAFLAVTMLLTLVPTGQMQVYADAEVSELNVYKSIPSRAVRENGKLYQTFEVNLCADKGIVSEITLDDITGSGLTNLSELKIKTVNGSNVGVTEGTTYGNMADLNAVLQGAVLEDGESITISYRMEVDTAIYTETDNMGKFANIMEAYYKDNQGNGKKKESNWVCADAKGPEMSKTATAYDETTGVITWKVTIKLNDYLEDFKNSTKSIEDYITDIVETPGTGLNAAVPVSGIAEEEEGIYSIVYTTSVTDDYKRRLEYGSYTFSNTISAKVGNKDVSASATRTTGTNNWISKSFLYFDGTTRTLTWDVTLNIPNGVSNVELTDFVQETTRHVVQPSVSYYGAVIAKAQDDGGSLVISDSSIVRTWESSGQGYKLGLTDDFVQKHVGQLVPFTFTTKIPDDFDWTKQTEFTNKVHLTYTDPVLGDQSQDVEATWKDENKQGVVITKKATPDGTKHSIAYEVRVDLSEIANLTTGETITLTDTLPDLMKFNDDATAKLVYVYQNSEDTSQGDVAITASDVADANARNFSFTVTDKMVAAVAAGSAASSWYKPTVVISYTASIADEKSFIMAGNTENITNSVTGKKGETSLGTATATAALTPKASETGSVTIKKFWMDEGTYTTLAGSVFKIVRAAYDADTGKMVDGAVIKDNIEVGVDGTITVENLEKDWIYALYETKAKDGYARRTDPYYFIIDDDDSVTLPSGITIEKFVNDENVLEYENQLEAELYITKTVENEDWDNVKNDITFTVKKGDLVIATVNGADMTKNGGVYVAAINQLEAGEYTVTETIAAGGKTPKTVTYKVGVNAAKTGQEATGIILLPDSYNTVAFTNTYEEKTGKIVITKTVLGNVDKAKAEAAISFKVTRTADGTSKTYKLSDFTYDTAGKIWTLELGAAPGGYQVEETRNAVGGFTLKKVQYEVDASGKVDGSLASIYVGDGASVKVAFENTYEKKTTTPSNPTTPPVTPTTPPFPWPPEPTSTDQGTPGTGDNSNLALFENTYKKKTPTSSNPMTLPGTPTSSPSPQPPEPTSTDQGTPDTGDNGNLALWFILFAVSGLGLGLAVLAVLDKKNKKK